MAALESTVILGAGIMGLSTAYFLSLSPNTAGQSIHLVESASELFASASGYAGGFLAEDWFSPPMASLGALSYRLHRELAEQHNGKAKWGYSTSTVFSLDTSAPSNGHDRDGSGHRDAKDRASQSRFQEFWDAVEGPRWLAKEKDQHLEMLGQRESTGTVNPRKLCDFLLAECRARGVQLHQPARAVHVSKDMLRNELASIRLAKQNNEEMDIPCSRLLIACGAWTPLVYKSLFPRSSLKIPIRPYAGHSIVLRSPRWSSEHEQGGCHAIFASDRDGISPEIFSRLGDEIYVAGLNDGSISLPDDAATIMPDREAIRHLAAVSNLMLNPYNSEEPLKILREGLCFRPITNKGTPIICRIPDADLGDATTSTAAGKGVFVLAGHGSWGISQSLGSGKVMSELMEDAALSADISGLGL